MRFFRLTVLLAALSAPPLAAAQQPNPPLAATAAMELQTLCTADAGALWGRSLCGPLLVADPVTRAVWATQPDREGALRSFGGGWTGVLPAGTAIATGALDWAGVRWAVLATPLPQDQTIRKILVIRESWRRLRPTLGIAEAQGTCAHLQTPEGRRLLRLELRALTTAVLSTGHSQRRAMEDALVFRSARQQLSSAAAADEASADRDLGLGGYTGLRLASGDAAAVYAARLLTEYEGRRDFGPDYAFASGGAYGLLLDQLRRDWRGTVLATAYSPADLLALEVRPPAPRRSALREAGRRYGADEVAQEEASRGTAR